MKPTRIWWKKVCTLGTFPDGAIKQDVYFEDDNHREYIWTAEWDKVIELYANARRVERTNKPEGKWMEEFEEVAKKAFEKIKDFRIIEGTMYGLEQEKLNIFQPGFSGFDLVSMLTGGKVEGIKYLIPILPMPSLEWLKIHHGKYVKCIVVNNEAKEIEDEEGNLVYPEPDIV